jgi:hypothetical protein
MFRLDRTTGAPFFSWSGRVLLKFVGSHADCLYKLQTFFGIPADTVPVEKTGKLCVDLHKRFLEKRRHEEQDQAKADVTKSKNNVSADKKGAQISVPASCDVLLGRGKGYFNHIGNVRYRSIIEEHKEEYDRATEEGRQEIAEGIVSKVHDYGGRFLKDGGGVWI